MNRSVVITGASGGIGNAIARRFAASKDRLFLIGCRNRENLENLKAELEAEGVEARVLFADLASPEGIAEAAEEIRAFTEAPDVLVNNAGISQAQLFQLSPDEAYLRLLHTNLSSYVRLTKALLPDMIRRKSGRILNVSSVWGQVGASMEVEYSLTKGGVDAFTKALAKELAPSGIAVNAVAPGLIDTKMNACYTEEELQAVIESIPAGRAGRPEEVADLLYLLSIAPTYLTGQVIRIDGGWI